MTAPDKSVLHLIHGMLLCSFEMNSALCIIVPRLDSNEEQKQNCTELNC